MAVLSLGASLLAVPAQASQDSVTHLVFEPGRFAAITEPQTLHYRFLTQGRDVGDLPPAPGKLEVRKIEPDGDKQVWLDLFEGSARRTAGPMGAKDQNPLLLVFFQIDVTEMSRLTAGSALYFQQQIRRHFNDMSPTEKVEVQLDGRPVQATRITFRPFAADPQIDQFPVFRDKSYEITVSDEVPGGVWSVVARTPDPKTGELILEKSMVFQGVEQ